jgi:hypothetical protein
MAPLALLRRWSDFGRNQRIRSGRQGLRTGAQDVRVSERKPEVIDQITVDGVRNPGEQRPVRRRS